MVRGYQAAEFLARGGRKFVSRKGAQCPAGQPIVREPALSAGGLTRALRRQPCSVSRTATPGKGAAARARPAGAGPGRVEPGAGRKRLGLCRVRSRRAFMGVELLLL